MILVGREQAISNDREILVFPWLHTIKMDGERYEFRIYRESQGYFAQGVELSECHAQARTWIELEQNIKKSAEMYLNG